MICIILGTPCPCDECDGYKACRSSLLKLQLCHPSRARRVRDYLTSPRARPSAVIAMVAVLIVSSMSVGFFVVQTMVIASCP